MLQDNYYANLQANVGNITVQTQDTITAHAGGGQGSATALSLSLNRVSICATVGDSVLLPISQAGLEIVVINSGAQNCNVFPQSGDKMNGTLNASVAVTPSIPGIFYCVSSGSWFSK